MYSEINQSYSEKLIMYMEIGKNVIFIFNKLYLFIDVNVHVTFIDF